MRRFILLLFLFLTTYAFADQYEMMRIGKLEIVPCNLTDNNQFDVRAIRSQLQTKVGGIFSQAEFDEDLKALAIDYALIEPLFEICGNELYIILKIWLKPTIKEIIFCGNEHVSTKKLIKEWGVSPGIFYDKEGFLEEFNKLRHLYVKKGYFESDLSYEVLLHDECNEVTIKITICEGRAGKIKEILFCGLTKKEQGELIDLMISKQYNFLLSWYIGGGYYNPEMIEHDKMQITNYFQNKGYADVVVDICLDQKQDEAIALCITVDKGMLYSIGHMAMKGNTVFSNSTIWSKFTFAQGSCYSPECIRQTIQSITDLYGACGYIDSAVDIQLSLRETEPVYDLCLIVEEGECFHVGVVKVFGNHCTNTGLILHENLLCPGEIFDVRKLKGTEVRLANTGYFKSVNVYAVKSQYEDPCKEQLYRDVYVEVQEADTGNVGLFFGFSSLERIFGGVEISEMNFNLAGVTRVLEKGPAALRGAGEYAHFKVNVGDRQTSYLAQWTKPYFMDTPWIVGIDLEKADNRVLSRAYEVKSYGGSAHATYIVNDYLKYNFYYRANHSKTSVKGEQSVLLEQEGAESGLISAVGFTMIYDSTDSPRKPTHGFRSRFIYELAGLGGNFSFMKFAYLNSYYQPMNKRGTLKFRADLQFIHTYRTTTPVDLPLGERFFLGGETTVRGYRPFVIGPLFGNLEPRGGVSSVLLSEEYQHNILKAPCLDAFIYIDAGMVSLTEFTFAKYAAATGFGFRVEAMKNVPMMFGVGWPIHPTQIVNGVKINNTQRFFFSMGGNF